MIETPIESSDRLFSKFDAVGQEQTTCTTYDQNGRANMTVDCGSRCFGFALNDTSNSTSDPCDFDPSILRVIAYQGIMDDFASILSGVVLIPSSGTLPKTTSIFSTTLVNTHELEFLNDESSNYLNPVTPIG